MFLLFIAAWEYKRIKIITPLPKILINSAKNILLGCIIKVLIDRDIKNFIKIIGHKHINFV